MAPNNNNFNRKLSLRSSLHSRSSRSRNSIFSFRAGQRHVSRILSKTGQSRVLQYMKRMSIFLLPMLTLIAMTTLGLLNAVTTSITSYNAQTALERDLAMADFIEELQLERGLSTMRQVEGGSELFTRIVQQIVNVDQALDRIKYWSTVQVGGVNITSKEALISVLNEKRNESRMSEKQPVLILHSYTEVTDGLLDRVSSNFPVQETGMIWKMMVAHLAMIQAMEHAGIERALGSIFFKQCSLSKEDNLLLMKSRAKSRILLQVAGTYHQESSELTDRSMSEDVIKHLRVLAALTRSDTFVHTCMNMTTEERMDYMLHWFDNMTQYTNALGYSRRNLSTDILTNINEVVQIAEIDTISYIIGSLVAVTLSTLAGFWNAKGLTRITETIGYHANKLHENNAKLEDERCKTETLLHSMLPQFVAKKLKRGEQVPPRGYESATVYFSDLMGFAKTTSVFEPTFTVQILNDVYTLFDGIIDMFDVYKVETVSDHYMVVSGVPEENGERHVVEIANMALMLNAEFSHEWRTEHCMGADLRLRAGFHSGSVVTGVVGRKLPRYCLFGDTVNTASRMQSKSDGGKIQLSESSANILKKQEAQFIVEERGLVEFKGKGKLRTFWLKGSQKLIDNTITAD